MVSLFSLSSADQSIHYLTNMFGYMDNVLPSSAYTIFGAMFKTINTTALVLGAIMIVHTTIMGLLKTAQEGEFLGRQWSSIWVPVRTVMGVAALFPTTAGYSLLQVIMMWIIVQGVGAADTLWTTVLDYISANGSVYTSVAAAGVGTSNNSNSITVEKNMEYLFQGLLCQATLRRKDTDTQVSKPLYFCGPTLDTSGKVTTTLNPNAFCTRSDDDLYKITTAPPVKGIYTYNMGPDSGVHSCGVLQFPDPATYVDPALQKANKALNPPVITTPSVCSQHDNANVIACAGLKAQLTSLESIIPTMGALAEQIAEFDHQYLEFYDGPPTAPPVPTGAITPPAKVFPTPDWVAAYCTDNKIATTGCCTISNNPQCIPSTTKPMPAAYYSGTGITSSWESTSTVAAQNIYLPYAINPILGNTPNEIQLMTNKYTGDVNTAVAAAAVSNATLGGDLVPMNTSGWLLAGAYYYEIASWGNQVQYSGMPLLNVMIPSAVSMGYRNNFMSGADLVSQITSSTSASVATSNPTLTAANSNLNGAAQGIVNNFTSEMSGSTSGNASHNPLITAQAFGESLLISAQVLYPITISLVALALFYSHLNVIVFGNGFTQNPAAAPLEYFAKVSNVILMGYCAWCFTFGGMLAVYLPMIPYIIFTMGAIGWFIAVIQAMAAAPFVALGILSPNGQHELLGKAEPAIMIMLNTFLRPTLMIFGMIASMILAPVVVTMINGGYSAVMGSIYSGSGHGPGPVELIMFISSYGTLLVTAMSKVFALIYMVPESALTWIGGQAMSYGESEGLNAVKSAAEGTARSVEGAAQSGNRVTNEGAQSISGSVTSKKRTDMKDKAEADAAAALKAKNADVISSGGESSASTAGGAGGTSSGSTPSGGTGLGPTPYSRGVGPAPTRGEVTRAQEPPRFKVTRAKEDDDDV
jgi:hypothetical protein